jgi:hypothetical protein
VDFGHSIKGFDCSSPLGDISSLCEDTKGYSCWHFLSSSIIEDTWWIRSISLFCGSREDVG